MMDNLIVIGAVALALALLLSANTPSSEPPRLIVVQTMQEAPSIPGTGCLGLILGIILFAVMVAMIGQVVGG